MMGENVIKVYIRGSVTRHNEITSLLRQLGATNYIEYKCSDPNSLYFINEKNEIDFVTEGSTGYHILINSGWEELKLREPKKNRIFMVKVTEGEQECENCTIKSYCSDERKRKCNFSKTFSDFIGTKLNGSSIEVIDYTDKISPPEDETYWPKGWN